MLVFMSPNMLPNSYLEMDEVGVFVDVRSLGALSHLFLLVSLDQFLNIFLILS